MDKGIMKQQIRELSIDPKVLEENLSGYMDMWGWLVNEDTLDWLDNDDVDWFTPLKKENKEYSYIDIGTCAERDQLLDWLATMFLKYTIVEFTINTRTYKHLLLLVPECFNSGMFLETPTFLDEKLDDYHIGWRYSDINA